ncbi:MAG: hypothetical protein PHN38_06305 [Sulfurospirillaceae bacterium]|nr:hypothetical protein [Sulfurospirillaceae bacterium]
MKKILFLLICATVLINASDIALAKAKIVSFVAKELVKKEYVSIYVEDIDYADIFGVSRNLTRTNSCENADIILIKNIELIPKTCLLNESLVIATSYASYKNTPYVVGAFFWQKGRPNIILKEQKLKELGIVLSEKLNPYIE